MVPSAYRARADTTVNHVGERSVTTVPEWPAIREHDKEELHVMRTPEHIEGPEILRCRIESASSSQKLKTEEDSA
jgi:hypothetical protein